MMVKYYIGVCFVICLLEPVMGTKMKNIKKYQNMFIDIGMKITIIIEKENNMKLWIISTRKIK